MKKKIGFLDYYIDEWHANEYPEMLAKSKWQDKFEVAYAWEEIQAPGKRSLKEWCRDNHVAEAGSIEELVEKSDAIVLLSPGWPEHHERLGKIPLVSGKPVYVDKPMSDSLQAAQRMFELADAHKTPVMSSSALRFSSHLQGKLGELQGNPVQFAASRGSGRIRGFINYGIHQIEILVMTLGTGASRVMQTYGPESDIDVLLIEYADGRRGLLNRMPGLAFELIGRCADKKEFKVGEFTDFFPNMIDSMMNFFNTGTPSIPREETLETVRIFDAGIRALEFPGKWIDVPAC